MIDWLIDYSQVTVVVVDCNDNAPIFELPIYEVRLTENSPLETVVLRILAHDADSGIKLKIINSIINHIYYDN